MLLCCRDVDEAKDWMSEKAEALETPDYGRDLRSVQALQRKHEGLERDLAALGEKVSSLSNFYCQIAIYSCFFRFANWMILPTVCAKHIRKLRSKFMICNVN